MLQGTIASSIKMSEPRTRRKSMIKKCQGKTQNLSEEEVQQVYLNRDYKPPTPKKLETIFEPEAASKKRGAAAELSLGKFKSSRTLEFQKYWLEDQTKSKHRSKMTTKSRKGRSPFKLLALTAEEESKLKDIIENPPADDENLSPNKYARSKQKLKISITPKIAADSVPNVSKEKVLENIEATRTEEKPKEIPQISPEDHMSMLKTPAREGKDIYTPNISKEEMLKQIEEADFFFGMVDQSDPKGQKTDSSNSRRSSHINIKKKQRRDSVTVRVRRSSRLFAKDTSSSTSPNSNSLCGSVYQTEEIPASKLVKRQRRRSSNYHPAGAAFGLNFPPSYLDNIEKDPGPFEQNADETK